jgi:hypothetical protein
MLSKRCDTRVFRLIIREEHLSSLQKKIDHLGDHLAYEVLMLCYTREQVNKDLYPLDWNALYESFAVHARSLMDFLSNANDHRNFNACTFSGTFSFKDDSELHRVVTQQMNIQVFHFGKDRTGDSGKKIDLEKVNKIHAWLMDNFGRFVAQLNEDLKQHWYPERCDPDKFKEVYEQHLRTKIYVLRQQNQTASTGTPGFWTTTVRY